MKKDRNNGDSGDGFVNVLFTSIDPGDIDNLGIKAGAIAHPEHPFGPVMIFAMLYRWHGHGCRVVADSGSDDEAYFEYRDITASVLEEYNRAYSESLEKPLQFTGKART